MLVKKRDGRLENFDFNKMFKWEIWACRGIKDHIDWKGIILDAYEDIKKENNEVVDSQDIQIKIINQALKRNTWYHQIVAGRLYAAYMMKKLFNGYYPKVKDLHEKLISLGLMRKLNYTDEEYEEINSIIDHSKDFELSYFQLKQLYFKYAICNKLTKEIYESPQFIFMRMAMDLSEDETNKMEKVRKFYKYLSEFKISAPTPNYVNLGTHHRGYISCCLYTVSDSAKSLAIGDHIAYTMTYMSAGIGGFLNVRSINDPVKNGLIRHMGKIPYFKSVSSAVNANMQSSRGGACTQYFMCYDPEVLDLIHLQNPRTPLSKQIRDIHFSMQFNDYFVYKVLNDEKIFTFNSYRAPDLVEAFFSGNPVKFKEVYEKYENDPSFVKNYISAREIAFKALRQAHEVATLYFINVDRVNMHTPFKDVIYQSNLCLEIVQPTKPYNEITDLYSNEKHERGEISLCALAAIVPSNIVDDNEYEECCYYALLMIDKCIDKNEYVFPHLEYTAKARRNAGIGMIGIAYDLAKRNLKYSSEEGKRYIHYLAERHAYYMLKASLRLGKEKGNCDWIHKTKWPDGWTFKDGWINLDKSLLRFELKYDWDQLSMEIKENKGIRNSCLIAYMPTESSSKATGLPNGIYPIRDIYLKKTDASNHVDFVVKESDILKDQYELAWDIDVKDMAEVYGIIQKFTDQAISADFYIDRSKEEELKSSRLMDEFIYFYKYGLKTRYYTNSRTTKSIKLEDLNNKGCSSGFCTL